MAAELAVDARVREVDPRLYASTLIDAVKHTAGAQLSQVPAAARGSDMRIRIQRVLRPHAKAPRRWRLAIASVLLFPIIAAQWSVVYATTKGPPSFEITPVEGRITSKFGRVPGPKKKKRNHTVIDISAPSGTPIVAPAAGRVVQAERSKVKYGNLLVLDHGNGFVTRYAHLKSFEVNVNDRVAVGEVIGLVGNTGYSTGPHLHFEVLRDGKPVDPAQLVPLPGLPVRGNLDGRRR
ncbi:MAG: M23 family metallopeptidase [Myxococcota bacterium]